MPALRGHHLVCLHFFNGEGYNETFITNLNIILAGLQDEVTIVCSGADQVCKGCSYLISGSCSYSDNADQEIRAMDAKALELLKLMPGDRPRWNDISGRVAVIFPQWFSLYCMDCNWRNACEKNTRFKKLARDYKGHLKRY